MHSDLGSWKNQWQREFAEEMHRKYPWTQNNSKGRMRAPVTQNTCHTIYGQYSYERTEKPRTGCALTNSNMKCTKCLVSLQLRACVCVCVCVRGLNLWSKPHSWPHYAYRYSTSILRLTDSNKAHMLTHEKQSTHNAKAHCGLWRCRSITQRQTHSWKDSFIVEKRKVSQKWQMPQSVLSVWLLNVLRQRMIIRTQLTEPP